MVPNYPRGRSGLFLGQGPAWPLCPSTPRQVLLSGHSGIKQVLLGCKIHPGASKNPKMGSGWLAATPPGGPFFNKQLTLLLKLLWSTLRVVGLAEDSLLFSHRQRLAGERGQF